MKVEIDRLLPDERNFGVAPDISGDGRDRLFLAVGRDYTEAFIRAEKEIENDIGLSCGIESVGESVFAIRDRNRLSAPAGTVDHETDPSARQRLGGQARRGAGLDPGGWLGHRRTRRKRRFLVALLDRQAACLFGRSRDFRCNATGFFGLALRIALIGDALFLGLLLGLGLIGDALFLGLLLGFGLGGETLFLDLLLGLGLGGETLLLGLLLGLGLGGDTLFLDLLLGLGLGGETLFLDLLLGLGLYS